jgi:hypothetical protein
VITSAEPIPSPTRAREPGAAHLRKAARRSAAPPPRLAPVLVAASRFRNPRCPIVASGDLLTTPPLRTPQALPSRPRFVGGSRPTRPRRAVRPSRPPPLLCCHPHVVGHGIVAILLTPRAPARVAADQAPVRGCAARSGGRGRVGWAPCCARRDAPRRGPGAPPSAYPHALARPRRRPQAAGRARRAHMSFLRACRRPGRQRRRPGPPWRSRPAGKSAARGAPNENATD